MATCDWPIDIEACCADTGMNPDDPADAARIASVVSQVSEMLSRWSGYAFGGCKTIRPLDPCGECRGGCCANGDCIKLHGVSAVTEVRVHGAIVDPLDYHFDPFEGTLCAAPPLRWPNSDPRYQAVGDLEVDVRIGALPDAWARSVANELACELLLSCAGDKKCRLPSNATRVTSQGITVELNLDVLKYSLPSVIAWVNTVNPLGATSPSRVFSPEVRRSSSPGYARAPWRR